MAGRDNDNSVMKGMNTTLLCCVDHMTILSSYQILSCFDSRASSTLQDSRNSLSDRQFSRNNTEQQVEIKMLRNDLRFIIISSRFKKKSGLMFVCLAAINRDNYKINTITMKSTPCLLMMCHSFLHFVGVLSIIYYLLFVIVIYATPPC